MAEFHTYPAPGVLIGAFMVDFAMELPGVTKDRKLYGVCETPECLPDTLQVMAHCTTGNNRLKVIPIGKFATSKFSLLKLIGITGSSNGSITSFF